MINISPNMQQKYAGTHFGVLILRDFKAEQLAKAAFSAHAVKQLQAILHKLQNYDRKLFSTQEPVICAYVNYYKKFKKSYHVLHQIESMLNGKSIPDTNPLIQALFLTELQTSMLIAGHDLAKTQIPLTIECAEGGESYLAAGGRDVVLKAGDIAMRDQYGFILSIIYGQDQTTRVTDSTGDILYLIDGVPGIDKHHFNQTLDTLLTNLRIFQPHIEPELMTVLTV